ncbi:MAG: ATP-dependent zinc metalloprotease FtsH [Pseudomonadota bacterium]
MSLWLLFGNPPPGTPLPYSEFKLLLHAGKLHDLSVSERQVSGAIADAPLEPPLSKERADVLRAATKGHPGFTTLRVTDPDLVKDLEAAHVNYTAEEESRLPMLLSWLAPGLLLLLFWRMAMPAGGGIGGLMEVGKSKARVYMQKDTGVTFKDIAGIDEARDELMLIVEFLKHPERYRRLGGRIPKGVLIVGAPGTGKTLLAKAVAGEAGVPFFSIGGSEFVEMFVGVGAARVRSLFEQAQQQAPCIIFIDELDALGKARGLASMGGHQEHEQTLNQLLVEMDGFDANTGVIIMAATNRPEVLDPALLRPGRFDRHIALDRPDLNGRRQILAVHVKQVRLGADVDLERLAATTAGFAGADLANLVNEAALHAANADKDKIDMDDFVQALDRIVGGIEKKTRVMNPVEKETVAYHESGHALVAELRPHADRVAKISIIPRGVAALGYTQQTPTEDRYLMRHSELLERLDVLLGGRVAEELVYGDVSTGAQNDLQRATELAVQMVSQYGMSSRLGLATYEQPAQGAWWNGMAGTPGTHKGYSERTARTIDAEVTQLLADAQARVRATLEQHRPILDALARRLLQTEVVERSTLTALLNSNGADAGDGDGAGQAGSAAGATQSAGSAHAGASARSGNVARAGDDAHADDAAHRGEGAHAGDDGHASIEAPAHDPAPPSAPPGRPVSPPAPQ